MIVYLIIDILLLRLYDTVIFSLTTVAGYFPSARFIYESHHNFSVQRTVLHVTYVCASKETACSRSLHIVTKNLRHGPRLTAT
jgi:hypothetical protein